MPNETNALTPDRFPILPIFSDSAVVWVISNNVDYHITLGALKQLMVANLPAAVLPSNIVTTEQLTEGLATKINSELLDGLVTAQQLNNAIRNIAPLDVGAAVANYFVENPIEVGTPGLTAEALVENETIVALQQALALKVEQSQLSSFVTIEENANKADKTALVGLASQEDVANAIAALPQPFQIPENLEVGDFISLGGDGMLIGQKISKGRVYNVVGGSNISGADGSIMRPFNDIQDAIDAVPLGESNSIIKVHPALSGSYGSIDIMGRTNMFIVGEGVIDAHPIKVTGSITIRGNSTRIRIKDLAFGYSPTVEAQLVISGTQGRHYFENVVIEPRGGFTGDTVLIENLTYWVDFVDCNIGGTIRLNGEPAASALVAMRYSNHPGTSLVIESNYTVRLNDILRIGGVKRLNGNLFINNVRNFTGVEGFAIVSEATPGTLAMDGVSLRREAGNYVVMSLQSGPQYRYGFNDFGVNANSLPDGEYVDAGASLVTSFQPTSYSPEGKTIEDHLRAIDLKFASLNAV